MIDRTSPGHISSRNLACTLLLDPTLTVDQIAERTGLFRRLIHSFASQMKRDGIDVPCRKGHLKSKPVKGRSKRDLYTVPIKNPKKFKIDGPISMTLVYLAEWRRIKKRHRKADWDVPCRAIGIHDKFLHPFFNKRLRDSQ